MLRSDATGPAVVVVAVLLAYLNALGAAFQFDDYNVIVNNPSVHSLPAWLDSMPGIRPLLKFSYALNWTFQPAPWGFHLFNVIVHALNAVLVHRLLQCLTAARWAPLVGALLFALHPAQTEAVTYLSGRSVSFMALFYLASMVVWLRAPTRQEGEARRVASAALFGAALLVKETAVTLPLALLLLDAYAIREPTGMRARLLRLRWHALVLIAAAAAMFASPTYRYLLEVSLSARAMLDNLLTQADAIFYLAAQSVLLWRMNVDPDLPVATGMTLALSLEIVLLAAILFAACRNIRNRSWLAFAALWFFLHLLPTNSLLPRLDVANDRQLYLALIGVFFAAGLGVEALLQRLHRPGLIAAVAVSALLVCAAATFQRNETYASAVSFWEDALAKSPRKARVANNLGYAYQQAGRYAEAKLAYQQAIDTDPDYWRARINLDALEATEKR